MELSIRMQVIMEEAVFDRFQTTFGFHYWEDLANAILAMLQDRIHDEADPKLQAYYIKRTEETLDQMKDTQKKAIANYKKMKKIERRKKPVEEADEEEDEIDDEEIEYGAH